MDINPSPGHKRLLLIAHEPATKRSNNGYIQDADDERMKIGANGNVFELVVTGNKGYALIATNNIPRGTRIIEESPFMAMPPCLTGPGPLIKDAEIMKQKTKDLSKDHFDAYHDLYHDRRILAKIKNHLISELNARNGVAPDAKSECDDPLLEMATALAIHHTNNMKFGTDPEDGSGVFPLHSRINHSCTPNLHAHYVPSTQKLIIHAVRQINKGEELLVSYIPRLYGDSEFRITQLLDWNFWCKCKACSGKASISSDDKRTRMRELEDGLNTIERLKKKMEEVVMAFDDEVLGLDALEDAEELLELCKAENITGYELKLSYRRCSSYSLACGYFDKAVKYAKKEVHVEHYCIGADTAAMPHMEQDLKGAEFWLKHIVDEQKEAQTKRKEAEKWLKEEMAREEAPKKQKKGGKGKKN